MVDADGNVRRRARLGDLHARRPARRRRAAAGVLDRSGRRATALGRLGAPPPPTASRAAPSSLDRYAERVGPRPVRHRLLRGVRVLEAGLHPRGRVRPLPRRRAGRRRDAAEFDAVHASRSSARRRRPAVRARTRREPTPYEPVIEQPDLDDAGARRRARRLDRRRRRGGAAAMAALEAECRPSTVATFDADTLHRLPRPPPDDAAARRRQHARSTWPEIELQAGHDRQRPRRAAADRVPSRTPRGGVRRSRSATLAVEFGASHDGRPRRLPVRRAPHPAAAAVDDALRPPSWPPACPTCRNSVDVPAGMQAALERQFAELGLPAVGLWAQVPHYVADDALPGGVARAARRAARGRRHRRCRGGQLRRRPRRPPRAASTSWSPATTSTPRMVAPARAGLRRRGRRRRRRPCRAATILPTGDELAAELERFLRDQG